MLDLAKIQYIAQSYSPQELFAALVWQRRFNQFSGEEVITDLSNHPDLWASFLFTKPIFAPDEDGEDYGWRLQRRLRTRLEGALSGEPMQPNRDAVVISYWWD